MSPATDSSGHDIDKVKSCHFMTHEMLQQKHGFTFKMTHKKIT